MAASSAAPDVSLIGDLCDMLESSPQSIDTRKLLAETYEACGWTEAAAEQYTNVLQIQPGEPVATSWLRAHGGSAAIVLGRSKEVVPAPHLQSLGTQLNSVWRHEASDMNLHQLGDGYRTLMSDAQSILNDLHLLQGLCPEDNLDEEVADLSAIASGRHISVIKVKPPPGARTVASRIKATNSNTVNVAFADLEAVLHWTRKRDSSIGTDELRDTVRKRSHAVAAALPDGLKDVADISFMHVEHELLGKQYKNDGGQTMLGDEISQISRATFWVTEDGFAWDMEELAQALKANSGVMRNPLSKQMFTADDVRAIVRHPAGKHLAALQLQQKELSNGVRVETIDRLCRMADILLDDQSADATPSRQAVDEFLSFAATLPESEQSALNTLRVPATDSHTGRAFDVTIGDAVADAKANRQCFHKTGDMLRQAATHLRTRK